MNVENNMAEVAKNLPEQHKKIADYLRLGGKFELFIRSQDQDYNLNGTKRQNFSDYNKEALIQHFKLVCDSYGKSLGSLVNKTLRKDTASRLTKKLNYFLVDYSRIADINPEHPIQVFSSHEENPGKITETGFHLACAQSGVYKTNHRYSWDIISLDEALKRSELKASRKTGYSKVIDVSSREIRAEEILQLNHKKIIFNPNKTKNVFNYYYEWTDFKGRKEELYRLHRFIDSPDKLLWWIITGPGGIGKSRLALQLCKELRDKGWEAGFLCKMLDNTRVDKFNTVKPTLIVVDYDFENDELIGQFIRSVYEHIEHWEHPLRIVFLKRSLNSRSFETFKKQDYEIISGLQYIEEGNYNQLKSMELKGLSDHDIDCITANVFREYSKLPDAKQKKIHASKNDKKIINNFLKERIKDNRPLFAIMAAYALAEEQDIKLWDIRDLLEYILRHYINIWEKENIDEKHINLLALATLTGGVNIEDSFYTKCVQKIFQESDKSMNLVQSPLEFDEKQYQILCDTGVKEQQPLKPDILGEYYIIKKWFSCLKGKYQIKMLIEIAWHYKPKELREFLYLVAEDFYEESFFDEIIDGADQNDKACHERTKLIPKLIDILMKKGNYDKANILYHKLKTIWLSSGKANELSVIIANAITALTRNKSLINNPEQSVEYLDDLESIFQQSKSDREVALRFAKCAVNITSKKRNNATLSVKDAYFAQIKALQKSWPDDIEILDRLSRVAVNMIGSWGNTEEMDLSVANNYLSFLNQLSSTYPNEIVLQENKLMGLANLVLIMGKTGNLSKTREYYLELIKIWMKQRQNQVFIKCLMSGMTGMMECYIKRDENHIAERYFKKLVYLWDKNKHIKHISLHFITVSWSLAVNCLKNKKFENTNKIYNQQLLVYKEYKQDIEISLIIMRIANSLIQACDFDMIDEAKIYYDQVLSIWSDHKRMIDYALIMGQSLLHMAKYYCNNKCFSDIEMILENAKQLIEIFPKNEILNYKMAQIYTYLSLGYYESNSSQLAKKYENQFYKLYEKYSSNEDFIAMEKEFNDMLHKVNRKKR